MIDWYPSIYNALAIGWHIVIHDATRSQATAHHMASDGCMGNVIHMRDIESSIRSCKRHIPDIFIPHDQASILESLSCAGIESYHFWLESLDGCRDFPTPDGIASKIECLFVFCFKEDAHGIPAGDISAVESGNLTNDGISYFHPFFRKDGDILKSRFLQDNRIFFVLAENGYSLYKWGAYGGLYN